MESSLVHYSSPYFCAPCLSYFGEFTKQLSRKNGCYCKGNHSGVFNYCIMCFNYVGKRMEKQKGLVITYIHYDNVMPHLCAVSRQQLSLA